MQRNPANRKNKPHDCRITLEEKQRHPATSSEMADNVAVARLYGEPLFSVPQDLYIPPDALEIFLETFEGPLDVLLYLIRKQNFNILDIPMAAVTRQYLDYIEEIRSRNLELAAEYLLMAAMLIEIKSRMLLPPKKSADGQEPEDPRAELARRLREYEQIKLAAQSLLQIPQAGRDFFHPHIEIEKTTQIHLPHVSIEELQQAWQEILLRARFVQRHKIHREELSVREYMGRVLKTLQNCRFVAFEDLFENSSEIAEVVVTFIALLELVKESLVEITQAEVYAPIYVRLSYQHN